MSCSSFPAPRRRRRRLERPCGVSWKAPRRRRCADRVLPKRGRLRSSRHPGLAMLRDSRAGTARASLRGSKVCGTRTAHSVASACRRHRRRPGGSHDEETVVVVSRTRSAAPSESLGAQRHHRMPARPGRTGSPPAQDDQMVHRPAAAASCVCTCAAAYLVRLLDNRSIRNRNRMSVSHHQHRRQRHGDRRASGVTTGRRRPARRRGCRRRQGRNSRAPASAPFARRRASRQSMRQVLDAEDEIGGVA